MRNLTLALVLAGSSAFAAAPAIEGRYLEVRSCDVYTGYCFANSEMGLVGREAILAWNVTRGSWGDVALDGLSVVAVLTAEETLGDVREAQGPIKAVLIVDSKADADQSRALVSLAKALSGKLTAEIAAIHAAPIEAELGTCDTTGACGRVKAGSLVEISTRCLKGKDHICGNEETYYPPLTALDEAVPGYTTLARYSGDELGRTWSDTGRRGAFIGTFSR